MAETEDQIELRLEIRRGIVNMAVLSQMDTNPLRLQPAPTACRTGI
ncbi:MAG: hypothetical protein U0528_08700 [Anaerolineae bacterium]